MKARKGIQWKALGLIVVVGGLALIQEARLPLPEAADGWALVVWVLLFYGALLLWVNANREPMEYELDANPRFTWHLRATQARQEEGYGD